MLKNTYLVRNLASRIYKHFQTHFLAEEITEDEIFDLLIDLEKDIEIELGWINSTYLGNSLYFAFQIHHMQSRAIVQEWKQDFELGN